MPTLYEENQRIIIPKTTQVLGKPTARAFESLDQLLLILPARIPATLWRQLPQGSRIQALLRRSKPGSTPLLSTRLNNKRQTAVYVTKADADKSEFENLTMARQMVAAVAGEKAGNIGVWAAGFAAEQQKQLSLKLLAAALAAAFPMPAYKSKAAPPVLRSIRLLGLTEKLDLTRTQAEASGNNLARWLTAMPANKLDAKSYAIFLQDLARENGWQFKKYSVAELKKMGAGAFLAVAQGNEDDSASIVRLRYRPASKDAKAAIALVGKGIIFDTGGTNLKPFSSMLDMHIDMGGSAVAVGTLLAMSQLGVTDAIDCWLAITENRTGPSAYKSQDVVTALNGTTIQTIHTDAEGRMALADALVLACEEKPKFVVDYATLTGACVNAVTTRYSGVFTNNPDLHPLLKRTGNDSGERVWPFPIGEEFLDDLKSETADIQQCSAKGSGDHILAASFLQKFVDADCDWVHVDLSACSNKGGLGAVPTEITGFGVRFSLNLFLDKNILSMTRN